MSEPTPSNISLIDHDHEADRERHGRILALAFGTLGVVYGDIGTSVLYAVKECFHESHGIAPTHDNVYGIMSLFFWALTLVVVVKYINFVLSADNKGEGGILSLLALVVPEVGYNRTPRKRSRILIILGLIGASLLAADGTITPSLTVLSAVEGLSVANPRLERFIVPVTIMILVGLFSIQRRGTAGLAKIFAPAMFVWFFSLIALAVPWIFAHPEILLSINPYYAFSFMIRNGSLGFFVLGAVLLCITGAEALYADLGHFGKKPIRLAWYYIVMPALMLNYFGQGAIILEKGGDVIENPFYSLAPSWAIYPLIALATFASIVASQALISGAFSLAQQAVQLGYSPRLTIIHTSEHTKGQIFVPEVNILLMIACIALVLIFQRTSNLAAAYGISVMGTMTITSILMFFVLRYRWDYSRWKSLSIVSLFLLVDIPFLSANLPKITHGGWFTIVLSALVLLIMTTWKQGRRHLVKKMREQFRPIEEFLDEIKQTHPHRVEGSAIFMTGNARMSPPALLHHYAHNHVIHKQVILLSIITIEVPVVPLKDVLEAKELGQGFYEVIAKFGFMQSPKVDKIFRLLRLQYNIHIDEAQSTYFLGRDILLTDGPAPMHRWRKTLFSFLNRNSLPATAYFGIPPNRVIEMGMQVQL